MSYCFDIGGSFLKFGTVGADGLVHETGRVKTPLHDFDAFVEAIDNAIAVMPKSETGGVSISIAGVIDPKTGISVIANVPSCHHRPLQKDLSEALGRPVFVTNDADCFALAEAKLGVGRGYDNVFAIILGSGVGGGLVINGQLVRGEGGIAGEWGHGPIVDPTAGGLVEGMEAFECGCGQRGCLDTVGGARGLERLYAALGGGAEKSIKILDLWRNGDPLATQTVAVCIEHLARALSVIVNVLGASIVPVGGGLANAADFICALDLRVRELLIVKRDRVLVVPGERRSDGGLVGAGLIGQTVKGQAA